MFGMHREQLYAGMAKVKITPCAEDINSYHQFISGGFAGVRQDMYARVLAMQAGDRKAVIVSAEIIKMPEYSAFCKRVGEMFGMKPTDIVIGGTQNHQCIVPDAIGMGPENRPEVLKHVEQQIHENVIEGIAEAFSRLQPARIGWDTGYSYINTNYDLTGERRAALSDTEYINRELFVLRIDSLEGKPMGCLLNYCLMGTMMAANYDNWICGDIHGAVSAGLEQRMGSDFVAMYLIGGSANAKPLFECNYRAMRPVDGNMEMGRVDLPLEAREMLRDVLATRQISDAEEIYSRIKCVKAQTYFRSEELFEEVDARDIPFFNKNDDPMERHVTGRNTHKLHLLSIGDELVFACANSITAMRLDMMVRRLLPVKTVFVSVEGGGIGYVMDSKTDFMSDGNIHSRLYSNEENEAIYLSGFSKLWSEAR